MDQVTERLSAGFVWPTVGHPGRVPLDALVPDPGQPRKNFDEAELDALAETMKSENGGEQREIITAAELSPEDRIRFAPARYSIVSGERRWRSAQRAGLKDVEIRVKKYASRAKHKLDMFMLNEGRVGLSNIENARYLAELMQDFNLTTQEELAALVGKDQVYVSQHLALLKLIPEVQELMSPTIPERSRLRMGTALLLSRLAEDVQRDLGTRMPKGEGVSTRRQVDWIKGELSRSEIQLATRTMKPATMRRVIRAFVKAMEKRVTEIREFPDFETLFDNSTPQQVLDLLGDVKDAQVELGELVEKIEQLSVPPTAASRQQPAAARPAAPQAPALKPQPPAPAPAPQAKPDFKGAAASFVEKRQAKPAAPAQSPTQEPPHAPRPVPAFSPATPRSVPAQKPERPVLVRRSGPEKTVTYYDDRAARKVTDKVTREKYLELWDKGYLGFQWDKKDRPSWMPTLEAAAEDWDKFCD